MLRMMSPFTYSYAQNNGPILSIIYFITLRAIGPFTYIYAQSTWAHSHIFTLRMIGPYSQLYILLCSEP